MSNSQSSDEVVPLWRMPMEQKQFSAWSGRLGDSSEAKPKGFTRYSGEQAPDTRPAADDAPPSNEADIFDIAYKKGWEDCEAAINEERVVDEEMSQRLSEALLQISTLQSAGSYEFILQAVEQLFRRCAEAALPDPELLQAWASQLAEYVDADQKGAFLVLHPDDLKLIDKDKIDLPLRADNQLPRGNVRISHAGGWIEKGSAVVLDELRGLIDEIHDGGADDNDG